ncbi:MAG: hypothetical protein ACTSSE_18465 [Candidatus Thorarchaeota archaeon]|jgi:hypothetical protein
MSEADTQPEPEPVNLAVALKQMKEDGKPPVGFHMMFFSSEFKNTEECPTLQLLKMLGAEYDFADTIKRQVFQMPKDLVIMSYEFAWLGGFEGLQEAMEGINKILEDQFRRMVETKTLLEIPQARISFLGEQPDYIEGGEEE